MKFARIVLPIQVDKKSKVFPMNFIHTLFRKKKSKKEDNSEQKKLNSATAKNVLNFLSFGLTYGAEILRDRYQPSSKVNEFIAVSGQLLEALKNHHNERLMSDSVVISVHINTMQKQIELTQIGRDVMLSLDGSSTIITHVNFAELYANLRNDIIGHGAIYGQPLHALAESYPTDFDK